MTKFNLDKLREIAEPRKLTRAEEAALKAYPKKMGMFYEADIHYKADLNKAARIKYIEGYEQAEKDLALTAKDIGNIFNKVRSEAVKWTATEACYPDVAKWFNEQKAKEK